jgi:hypothetical protein
MSAIEDLRKIGIVGTIVLALTGCGPPAHDDRVHQVEGQRVPGGEESTNRHKAEQLCPNGYTVLDTSRDTEPYAGGTIIKWTIRCL